MQHFKFVQNTACEYFPCHKEIPLEQFNCLFCYCPLYALKEECGGDYAYLKNGIKSCMGCSKPHELTGYEHVAKKIKVLVELVKKEEH